MHVLVGMVFPNTVPDDWATIEIAESMTPTESLNYTLLCTVTFSVDLGATSSIVWLDQNGRVMHSGSNVNIWYAVIGDKQTRLGLMFKSLQPTDEQVYTCNVSAYLPHLDKTIIKAAKRRLTMTSKRCCDTHLVMDMYFNIIRVCCQMYQLSS